MVLTRDAGVQVWGYDVQGGLSCVGKNGHTSYEHVEVESLDGGVWSMMLPSRPSGNRCVIEVAMYPKIFSAISQLSTSNNIFL